MQITIEQLNQLEQKQISKDLTALKTTEHKNVYQYILHLINSNSLLNKETLSIFHALYQDTALSYQDKFSPSDYRNCTLIPLTKNHRPPMPEDLSHLMEHYLNQINTSKGIFSPIEYAVLCHKRFLDISPFSDYNLEVGKLLLNYLLLTENQICFLPDDDREYFKSLNQAQQMDYPVVEPLIQYISSYVVQIK